MKTKLIKREQAENGDSILTFEKIPGWLLRLFGVKRRIVKYIGSSTVWYTYPGFKRCGTEGDYWLTPIERREIYRSLKNETA